MKKTTAAFLFLFLCCFLNIRQGLANKYFYLGAGTGYGGPLEGDFHHVYNSGMGRHLILGVMPNHRIGIELEYGTYDLKAEDPNSRKTKIVFGGYTVNMKYFLGSESRYIMDPYFLFGAGINTLQWDYKNKVDVSEENDGFSNISIQPGLGMELKLYKLFAINITGRYQVNFWKEKSLQGYKLTNEKPYGNFYTLNVGLMMHF
ncbi:outer membrane beta-barrel protein [candidate division KSB1 bacterium]|nr:outer membrane beta-barrel protein [candidate division KSB1 bacterium]